MKNVILLIFLITFTQCSPALPLTGDITEMEKIFEYTDKNKDQLFLSVNSWFVETFNSAESVIEYSDKDQGRVMGKYVFSFEHEISYYNAKQTIIVDIKDNKIKVAIKNPYKIYTGSMLGGNNRHSQYTGVTSMDMMRGIRTKWDKLMTELTEYITEEKSSDW